MKNKVPIYLINKYQKATENKEHRCRYFPSCSQYAKECYEGILRWKPYVFVCKGI